MVRMFKLEQTLADGDRTEVYLHDDNQFEIVTATRSGTITERSERLQVFALIFNYFMKNPVAKLEVSRLA